jgi:hypothetical protein
MDISMATSKNSPLKGNKVLTPLRQKFLMFYLKRIPNQNTG